MGWFHHDHESPLEAAVKESFPGAAVVAIPEERIQPLLVITNCRGKLSLFGDLSLAVAGDPLPITPEMIASSAVPGVAGKKTHSFDVGMGLTILGGVLQSFGVDPPQVSAKFDGARELAFSFGGVVDRYIDNFRLGRLVQDRLLDTADPALSAFFGDDACPMIVLNSVLTSSELTVSVERKSDPSFQLQVPAIKDLVGSLNANVEVTSSSALAITFKGDAHIGFAFRALHLYVDENGRIKGMPPNEIVPELAAHFDRISGPEMRFVYAPDHAVLGPEEQSALLEWDEDHSSELSEYAMQQAVTH
jgi:hypothetical protein